MMDQKFFMTAKLTGRLGHERMEGMEKLEQLGGLCGEPPLVSRDELVERLEFFGFHDHAAAIRMLEPNAKFRLTSDGPSIMGDDWETVS